MFFVLVIFVLMVYIGSPVSALVARTYVEKQHTYFIFADKPNIAVIRLYQDMIACDALRSRGRRSSDRCLINPYMHRISTAD